MPITATPDHVAVAVPSIERAGTRWHEQLGGAWCSPKDAEGPDFATQQLRYRGGAVVELLEPTDTHGFAAGFVARFGARVHHVTLKVPHLPDAIATIEAAGYDVVDVDMSFDLWHEAFLRPSQVGGIIVQVARTTLTTDQWAARRGMDPEPVPVSGPRLLGPTLFHPDLDACTRVWETLGGQVDKGAEAVQVVWDSGPLTVEVQAGPLADPVLRFADAPELAADRELGPATVAVG